MTAKIMLRDLNNDFDECLNKFWTCIQAWLQDGQNIKNYIHANYKRQCGDKYFLNIDYENEYNCKRLIKPRIAA